MGPRVAASHWDKLFAVQISSRPMWVATSASCLRQSLPLG